jgi:ribose-phosphate pyrophosphokinase
MLKILNLVYPEKSDISFKIINFPDGQQDIIINQNNGYFEENEWMDSELKKVMIKSRFNTFRDLELIICTTNALRGLNVKEIYLYTPYLLGSRSDRQFVKGGTSYLVDVVAPIINSLNFKKIKVMDVHSDVAAACIKNLEITDNVELVRWSLQEIYGFSLGRTKGVVNNDFILVSPDSGSLKKMYKVAENIGYKDDIIVCSKYRDNDGYLSKVNVPIQPYNEKDVIIIDDICDGGATFINIAKIIKETEGVDCKLYLIVTHGIFSKGFDGLEKYFNGIFCTNSYKQHVPDYNHKYIIKQLEIY